MKGDFSRNSFNPAEPYHSVRMQQGRILLDADWNEQADLLNFRQARLARQLLGEHGGMGDSFGITLMADEAAGDEGLEEAQRPQPRLQVTPGQYVVGGHLCELDGIGTVPSGTIDWQTTPAALVYLDVWERQVTAVEDPALADPALRGADTTTRTRLVWQVRLLPLSERPPDDKHPEELDAWSALVEPTATALAVRHYRAIENSLYRIEIHAVDADGVAWKWSRDNGSTVFRLSDVASSSDVAPSSDAAPPTTVTAKLVDGPAPVAALATDIILELTCSRWEESGRAGIPARLAAGLDALDQQEIELELGTYEEGALDELIEDHCPLLQRWDVPAGEDRPSMPRFTLEEGADRSESLGDIDVTFPGDGRFRVGDYWQVPVRSHPASTDQAEVALRRAGPWHAYAPLAMLWFEQGWQIRDVRRRYATLTDVFDEIGRLRSELQTLDRELTALHEETDREHAEQQADIADLQREVGHLRAVMNQLAIREDGRTVQTYYSDQELDVGEVVGFSQTSEDHVVRASESVPPIGVVAPPPEGLSGHEYNVVLSGPALCRVFGRVDPGDLLQISAQAGHLEPTSLWTRWFVKERIFARAIDLSTTSNYELIDVYVLPQALRRARSRKSG